MYIRLGNIDTSLNKKRVYDDFMIVAGVIPECQMSYERPVLIRDKESLLLWFGENNTRRDFYEELLDSGASLYLTKPSSGNLDYTAEGYIDLSTYQTFEENIPFALLPKKGSTGVIYDTADKGKFIWLKEDEDDEENDNGYYISINDLPQFSSSNSTSAYNRDTLILCSHSIKFFHPRYSGNHFKLNQENSSSYSLTYTSKDIEDIDSGKKSIVFKLAINPSNCEDGDYILFPNKTLIYWGNNPDPKLQGYYVSSYQYSENIITSNIVGGLIQDSFVIFRECKNVTNFYKGNGIIFEPDFKRSQDIIEDYINDKGEILKFWSKTLGGKNEKHIKLSLSKIENENKTYRIDLERFGYSEVFEGTLQELETAITSQSRLIGCSIISKEEEPPEGTWELLGAEEENYTSGSYRSSIESLKDDDILPDFYLIPNPEDYVDGTENYENLYLFLLGLTTSQYLIQNNETNYIFNYTKDVDNRLVWFYKTLEYQGQLRDGYYLFLLGILNNIFSVETIDVVYEPFTSDENEDIIKDQLQTYKSNYLTDNNHKCFYKNYLNGKKFNTTILMRFCIEKVKRELEKNKWNFLGKKLVLSSMEDEIYQILNRIRDKFNKIIRNIVIENSSYYENYMSLEINTVLSDLPKNDLTLDIKINYIK